LLDGYDIINFATYITEPSYKENEVGNSFELPEEDLIYSKHKNQSKSNENQILGLPEDKKISIPEDKKRALN